MCAVRSDVGARHRSVHVAQRRDVTPQEGGRRERAGRLQRVGVDASLVQPSQHKRRLLCTPYVTGVAS